MLHRAAWALLLVPLAVLAGEALSDTTQTGSIIAEDPTVRWARLAEGFPSPFPSDTEESTTIPKDLRRLFARLPLHLAQCRWNVRTANRDEEPAVTMRCYKTQLSLERDLMVKERELISSMAGVSKERKKTTLEAVDTFAESLRAVMEGIDVGVFRTREELLEAKKNLHERYRMPAYARMQELSNIQEHGLISSLLLRWPQSQSTSSSSKGDVNIDNIQDCFVLYEEFLASPEPVHISGSLLKTSQQQVSLKKCIESDLPPPPVKVLKNMESSSSSKEGVNWSISPRRRYR